MLNGQEESYSMGIGFGATQRGAYVQVKESLFVFNFLSLFCVTTASDLTKRV